MLLAMNFALQISHKFYHLCLFNILLLQVVEQVAAHNQRLPLQAAQVEQVVIVAAFLEKVQAVEQQQKFHLI
jgi:hypothetical protein